MPARIASKIVAPAGVKYPTRLLLVLPFTCPNTVRVKAL